MPAHTEVGHAAMEAMTRSMDKFLKAFEEMTTLYETRANEDLYGPLYVHARIAQLFWPGEVMPDSHSLSQVAEVTPAILNEELQGKVQGFGSICLEVLKSLDHGLRTIRPKSYDAPDMLSFTNETLENLRLCHDVTLEAHNHFIELNSELMNKGNAVISNVQSRIQKQIPHGLLVALESTVPAEVVGAFVGEDGAFIPFDAIEMNLEIHIAVCSAIYEAIEIGFGHFE